MDLTDSFREEKEWEEEVGIERDSSCWFEFLMKIQNWLDLMTWDNANYLAISGKLFHKAMISQEAYIQTTEKPDEFASEEYFDSNKCLL